MLFSSHCPIRVSLTQGPVWPASISSTRVFLVCNTLGDLVLITMPSAIGVWQEPTSRLDPSTSTTQMRQPPMG